VDDGALVQNAPGDNFYATENTFGATFDDMLVPATPGCDFNGDGVPDMFLATGATWWYHNAFGPGSRWLYLFPSPRTRDHLTLGDVNSDGICDVQDDTGVVYLGGVTPVLPPPPVDPVVPDVTGQTLAGAESALEVAGLTTGTVGSVPTCENVGLVARQNPAAGSPWSAGMAVDLSIGKEPSRGCSGIQQN
jgi:hypothetical protein